VARVLVVALVTRMIAMPGMPGMPFGGTVTGVVRVRVMSAVRGLAGRLRPHRLGGPRCFGHLGVLGVSRLRRRGRRSSMRGMSLVSAVRVATGVVIVRPVRGVAAVVRM